MPTPDRPAVFVRGAQFFEGDEGVMFQYNIDASSTIGPRKVTEADKKDHSGEWNAFLETLQSDPLPQLDHDGDGKPGGSLPHEPALVTPQLAPASGAKRRGRPPKG